MDLNEYQSRALRTAFYPADYGLVYTALKLNGEAGEYAEHVGKALRDDDGDITEQRHWLLIKELGDVLWYIAACAKEIGVTLEEVGQINLDKLEDRNNRNKLKGSGDER